MLRRAFLSGLAGLLTMGATSWPALGQWHLKSFSNAWSGRDGAGLLSLGDDLYMLGGWNPYWSGAPTTNEVWKSSDRGQTWVQLPNAPWEGRHSAGWVSHGGKLWVIGGDANLGHYQRDVWSGTPNGNGISWVLASSNAVPLSHGRVLHQVFSHDGKLWIIGGQTLDEFATSDHSTKPGSPYYSDVWSSADGASWTLVSDGNAWAPRGLIIGNTVKDGHIWLVGGGAYNTEGYGRVFKNDVWKSPDGVVWTFVAAATPFAARQYQNVVTLGPDLVLIAGYNGGNIADAWASRDGETWRQLWPVPWAARHAASAVEHNGEVIFMCGPLTDTAVWGLS